jgi:hypothetical protein
MSTNAHGFLGFLEVNLCFWGLSGDLGENMLKNAHKMRTKCLRKVSKCQDSSGFVRICAHLYSFVLVNLK